MLKVYLLWPGKTKEPWIKEGLDFYLKRLKNYYQVTIIETRPSRQKGKNPEQSIKEEGRFLLEQIKKIGAECYVLDVKGREISSEGLAKLIKEKEETGQKGIVFVIGGAYGIDEEVLKKANKAISLSKMTFTHEMARLILLEQLYRAASINTGSPYHH